jgi:hypothetical protein
MMTTSNHKAVNSTSTNRWKCKHASDDLSRSTPDQNNLSQCKHTYITRLTLKMNCPSPENAEDMILSIFGEVVEELVHADSTAAILPWKSIHR